MTLTHAHHHHVPALEAVVAVALITPRHVDAPAVSAGARRDAALVDVAAVHTEVVEREAWVAHAREAPDRVAESTART